MLYETDKLLTFKMIKQEYFNEEWKSQLHVYFQVILSLLIEKAQKKIINQ